MTFKEFKMDIFSLKKACSQNRKQVVNAKIYSVCVFHKNNYLNIVLVFAIVVSQRFPNKCLCGMCDWFKKEASHFFNIRLFKNRDCPHIFKNKMRY